MLLFNGSKKRGKKRNETRMLAEAIRYRKFKKLWKRRQSSAYHSEEVKTLRYARTHWALRCRKIVPLSKIIYYIITFTSELSISRYLVIRGRIRPFNEDKKNSMMSESTGQYSVSSIKHATSNEHFDTTWNFDQKRQLMMKQLQIKEHLQLKQYWL